MFYAMIKFCGLYIIHTFVYQHAVYEPLFAKFRESRYEKKLVMISNLTQGSTLLKIFESDPDRLHEVEETLTDHRPLFVENPCSYGCFIVGVQEGFVKIKLIILL